ncbi:hypothetical protein C8Q80DRAFT_379828 [Daedaleopsis nitida]|nr:hypothetical protein C8Q80DRAFT_379828 [Daedaleopsis nitida]
MRKQRYVLQLPESGLFVTAMHYTPDRTEVGVLDPASSTETLSRSGSTCVLAHSHCDSKRKDDWDIIISRLFHLCATAPDWLPLQWRVRDAWALDPHIYREPAARQDEHTAAESCPVEEYANVLRYFVTSKMLQGRSIIAVGYSESAAAWTIACFGKTIPSIRAVIFVEPIMKVVGYRYSRLEGSLRRLHSPRHAGDGDRRCDIPGDNRKQMRLEDLGRAYIRSVSEARARRGARKTISAMPRRLSFLSAILGLRSTQSLLTSPLSGLSVSVLLYPPSRSRTAGVGTWTNLT